MKHLRLALVVVASSLGLARAQDEKQGPPPTEIPDFSNLDEYFYVPKSTVTFGVRRLSPAKTQFSGTGKLNAPEDPGAATGANALRIYHDGSVQADGRGVVRRDETGNAILDADGFPTFDPITPDGKTNTWNYISDRQLRADGNLSFHSYSAEIIDTASRETDSLTTYGMDIVVMRDMGKLLGSRFSRSLTAGMSINDISANMSDNVRARLTALTDTYSLFGQTPPPAPYSAPSFETRNVLDATGNPVLNEDGTSQLTSVETSVLLGNEPLSRINVTTIDATSVSNRWKLKGAYYTFRVGPTIWLPLFSRLRASVSVGAAFVYAGTNYTVTQTYQPEFGAEFSDTTTTSAYKLLPGYYADATLQFDLTERAGFYAGAIFQSAGDYTQNLETATANYTTKVDLSKQSGLRAGMTVRF